MVESAATREDSQLDATYVKVREGGHVVARAVLIATEVADKESHVLWGNFIQTLSNRGLKSVAWVISDHHEG